MIMTYAPDGLSSRSVPGQAISLSTDHSDTSETISPHDGQVYQLFE